MKEISRGKTTSRLGVAKESVIAGCSRSRCWRRSCCATTVPSDLVIVARSVRDCDVLAESDLRRRRHTYLVSLLPSSSSARSGLAAVILMSIGAVPWVTVESHRNLVFLPPLPSSARSGLVVADVTSTGAAPWGTR